MPDTPYGLGRRHAADDRDCLYPVSLVLDAMSPARRTTPWKRPRVLDQGQTGTCVGHGWRGWYEGEPTLHTPDEGPDAFAIYRKAVLLDTFPDNDGDATAPQDQLQSGSTVRAGAKAMQEAGLIGSYVWATRAAQVADYVTRAQGSPVVVGTQWRESMFEPDPRTGKIKIAGRVAGGHCWDVFWWDGRLLWGFSSWGDSFGVKDENGVGGVFKLSLAQMDRLLREQGEACMGVERIVQPVQTP